ncbi:MAG: translation initiation factor [Deltaproteobacteria bacterium]|nr:translation initiation factor [Deltaproteobacteria bacterium]
MANHPFDKLKALRDALPPGPTTAAITEKSPVISQEKAPPRAVLRYERKGRGGKEVTWIEQLALSETGLATWCRDAKSALGCGGSIEDGAIMLHGDQRKRLGPWLTARGVKKIAGG